MFVDKKNNILTELEMTFDARQNGGNARYVKHCKAACIFIIDTQKIQSFDWPK